MLRYLYLILLDPNLNEMSTRRNIVDGENIFSQLRDAIGDP